ncbi:6-phosphogluconolactonase [Asticcacaulis sp. EMRT-3]|uniref:6-phosphogluconolactonase n=1 Tax=Asticcacaulis sp. EMRT-3 TaxID=3040349 RepID=UPI0024AFEFE0|nr:6-phosphogluconolactonase [Asticcacaulis sp. EMRT-3]MDI7775353.1 6-phosphogluconolactonase [Asticcacaulis sp. EMRT-3]
MTELAQKIETLSPSVRIHEFADKAEAGAFVADQIAEALQQALDERGQAVWVGCGGTTPKPVYERLNEAVLDWSQVTLAQVDERWVPTDSPDSNTRMMREALAPAIDAGLVLESLIQDLDDQQACADKAEAVLRDLGDGDVPPKGVMFDFALLGMGPDGHYASIFPQHPINATVYDGPRLVLPVAATDGSIEPKLPRITLTVPAINASRRIVFFITGQAKLDVLKSMARDSDPFVSPIGAFLAQCPVPVDFVWSA